MLSPSPYPFIASHARTIAFVQTLDRCREHLATPFRFDISKWVEQSFVAENNSLRFWKAVDMLEFGAQVCLRR